MGGFTQFSWGFFLDGALLRPVLPEFLVPGGPTFQLGATWIGFAIDTNAINVSSLQSDVQVWFGSPTNFGQFLSASGASALQINLNDDGSAGASNPVTRFYLAQTEPGLDSAVAGASLLLNSAVVSGGAMNAKNFWIRYKVPTSAPEFGCAETVYTNVYVSTLTVSGGGP